MSARVERCVACGCALDMHPNGGACTSEAGAPDACPCGEFVPAVVPEGWIAIRIDEDHEVRVERKPLAPTDDIPIKVVDSRNARTFALTWQPRYDYVDRDEYGIYNGSFRYLIARALRGAGLLGGAS